MAKPQTTQTTDKNEAKIIKVADKVLRLYKGQN